MGFSSFSFVLFCFCFFAIKEKIYFSLSSFVASSEDCLDSLAGVNFELPEAEVVFHAFKGFLQTSSTCYV